jgi:3-hydroxyisobutyrate dehydrogenase-like beta-hydroxyacid dehydrogenase
VGKLKKIEAEDYSPQFPLRLMSKDMDLIMETARSVGAELTAGRAAKSVLDASLKKNGDLDLSAITPFVVHRTSEPSNP